MAVNPHDMQPCLRDPRSSASGDSVNEKVLAYIRVGSLKPEELHT